MEKLTGKEEFTVTFTAEELGLMAMGLATLQDTLKLNAMKSYDNLKVYEDSLEIIEPATTKIYKALGLDELIKGEE